MNSFERIEKDPPREKFFCIERESHISLSDLTNICADNMKKIMEETENELIKKMENHATSNSKTTKKRTAKIHSKSE